MLRKGMAHAGDKDKRGGEREQLDLLAPGAQRSSEAAGHGTAALAAPSLLVRAHSPAAPPGTALVRARWDQGGRRDPGGQ